MKRKCYYFKKECIKGCAWNGEGQPHGYAGDDCEHKNVQYYTEAMNTGNFILWSTIITAIICVIIIIFGNI